MDAERSRTVLVVAGGDPVRPDTISDVPSGAPVVAADSGVDLALALGLHIDVAVGDFDSVTDEGLERATRAGARIERHPQAKDAIDLELGLDAAVALGADHIVVVGGSGGRPDLHLANLLLLAHPKYAGLDVESRTDSGRVHVVRRHIDLTGRPGQLVSLVPVHGPAKGVATEGLVYRLHGEDLPAGTSRGLSNELVGTQASVRLEEGVLLCILCA